MIRFFILICGALLLMGSGSTADDFTDFLRQNQADIQQAGREFEAYKEAVARDFATYQQITAREYKRYRKSILRYWGQAEISDKKRWVEYTPDWKTRKLVDFEKGIIRIETIQEKPDRPLDKTLRKHLIDLIREDSRTAFQRDPLAQNIEKKIIQKAKTVKAGRVSPKPILADIVTGSTRPTKKQVDQAAARLQQKGTVRQKASGKIKGAQVVTLTIPLPPDSIRKKAATYNKEVRHYADQRKLDPAIVFAVIHTESAFNPMARSHVPAYGLMQIVPQSAGMDASKLVFGKPVLLSPSFLYDGGNNINMGSAYLHLLFNRYLKPIKNPESRLYCAIAAYNTGAGNVARAFTGTTSVRKAARRINRMTSKAVYKHLLEKLPYAETRQYVKRVVARIALYRPL